MAHIQQRDNRWYIIDRVGKHGRVRAIPMPTWAKSAVDAWTSAAGFSEGPVLRRVSRGNKVQGAAMSEKVVWQLLQRYAAAVGVPGIAPHAALHLPGPPRIIVAATVNRRFDFLDIVSQLSGLAWKLPGLAADIVYRFTMRTPVWRNEREMIDNRTVMRRYQLPNWAS